MESVPQSLDSINIFSLSSFFCSLTVMCLFVFWIFYSLNFWFYGLVSIINLESSQPLLFLQTFLLFHSFFSDVLTKCISQLLISFQKLLEVLLYSIPFHSILSFSPPFCLFALQYEEFLFTYVQVQWFCPQPCPSLLMALIKGSLHFQYFFICSISFFSFLRVPIFLLTFHLILHIVYFSLESFAHITHCYLKFPGIIPTSFLYWVWFSYLLGLFRWCLFAFWHTLWILLRPDIVYKVTVTEVSGPLVWGFMLICLGVGGLLVLW